MIKPLDQSLEAQAQQPISREKLLGLRYFWLDGLFATISENFYAGFVSLFALAYGASSGQVGWLASVGNLLGAVALFPGARMVERTGKRVPIVVWTGGGIGRIALLALASFPFLIKRPDLAIPLIIGLNGLRAFMGNFGNPAWTAIVADLVPGFMRGRYFANRNIAMGVAALVVAPLAGWMINAVNGWQGMPFVGYQLVFFLAFASGMVATASFGRIPELPSRSPAVKSTNRATCVGPSEKAPVFWGLSSVRSSGTWRSRLPDLFSMCTWSVASMPALLPWAYWPV